MGDVVIDAVKSYHVGMLAVARDCLVTVLGFFEGAKCIKCHNSIIDRQLEKSSSFSSLGEIILTLAPRSW